MVAGFSLALPAGVYPFFAGLDLGSAGPFLSATWLFSVLFWIATFGPMVAAFGLLFLSVREWAVRTAKLPADEEFEMPLNRVYPPRKRLPAAGPPPPVPGADRGDAEAVRLAGRPAF
jgi:hypothetical protein